MSGPWLDRLGLMAETPGWTGPARPALDAPPAGPPPLPGPEAPHALVIGGGFGGLAAALRLSCRGYRVTVLEALDQFGGRARVFREDGHVFDMGPTIVTVPHFFEELWTLAGRRLADDVELQKLDPCYRILFDDGSHFDYSSDGETLRREIARLAPGDLAGYERFSAHADRCWALGFGQLGAKAFDSTGDLLAAIPHLVRMQGWRTLHALVAQHFRDPRLRMVFSLQSLLIGGNPFSVTAVYSLIHALERRWGVHWAKGGTGALVQGLVGLLRERGVVLETGAEVTRIDIQAQAGSRRPRATGVRLADGRQLPADVVVCNSDVAWTQRKLIEPRWRKRWTDERVERADHSMSLFVWYFGTDRQWPEVPHHMMVLGPRYRGLLDDIFKHHHLAEDFSLYLHRPTATDVSMGPPGMDTFYVLSPVPHLGSGTDWPEVAERYRQAVQERLEATVLPGLGQHLRVSRLMTPQHFHDELRSHQGAAFGLEPTLMQSAGFRPHNRSEDIDALYFVGAGTHPGAGIPGVLMSAKALQTVLPDPGALARPSHATARLTR